jgi:hypothetical protein
MGVLWEMSHDHALMMMRKAVDDDEDIRKSLIAQRRRMQLLPQCTCCRYKHTWSCTARHLLFCSITSKLAQEAPGAAVPVLLNELKEASHSALLQRLCKQQPPCQQNTAAAAAAVCSTAELQCDSTCWVHCEMQAGRDVCCIPWHAAAETHFTQAKQMLRTVHPPCSQQGV